MGDGERDGQVDELDVGLVGESDELLDGVDPSFVAEMSEDPGAAQVGRLSPADASGEHALGERAPHEDSHAVPLRDGDDLALDAAVVNAVPSDPGACPHPTCPANGAWSFGVLAVPP